MDSAFIPRIRLKSEIFATFPSGEGFGGSMWASTPTVVTDGAALEIATGGGAVLAMTTKKTSGREGFSSACALSLCESDRGGVADGHNGESITQSIATVVIGEGKGVAFIEDVITV